MLPAEIEPAIPANNPLHTYPLERTATDISLSCYQIYRKPTTQKSMAVE